MLRNLKSNSSKSPKKYSSKNDCRKQDNCADDSKIYNPKTGRCVKEDSSALFTIALELLEWLLSVKEGKEEQDDCKMSAHLII